MTGLCELNHIRLRFPMVVAVMVVTKVKSLGLIIEPPPYSYLSERYVVVLAKLDMGLCGTRWRVRPIQKVVAINVTREIYGE